MRAVMVAVLATLVAGVPGAAQRVTNPHAALLAHERQALAIARRLQSPSYKELKAARLKSELAALGKHLDGADAAIAELGQTATGTDKETLDNVTAHHKEVRAHYDELVRAQAPTTATVQWESRLTAGIEAHTQGVIDNLSAAIAAQQNRAAARGRPGRRK